jgi:hypothetical protein
MLKVLARSICCRAAWTPEVFSGRMEIEVRVLVVPPWLIKTWFVSPSLSPPGQVPTATICQPTTEAHSIVRYGVPRILFLLVAFIRMQSTLQLNTALVDVAQHLAYIIGIGYQARWASD